MCRSIKPLFNFNPPASDAEISGAAVCAQGERLQPGLQADQAACDAPLPRSAKTVRTLLRHTGNQRASQRWAIVAAQAPRRQARRSGYSRSGNELSANSLKVQCTRFHFSSIAATSLY